MTLLKTETVDWGVVFTYMIFIKITPFGVSGEKIKFA